MNVDNFRLLNKKLHRWLGLFVIPFGGILLITGVMLNHEKRWFEKGSVRVFSLAAAGATGQELLRGTSLGLERSTDGGTHWSAVETPWPTDDAVSLVSDPRAPGTLYAVMKWLGVIRSRDGGHVWESVQLPFQPEISGTELKALAVNRQGKLFLQTSGGLLVSDDDGGHWQPVTFDERHNEPGFLARSLHNAFFFGPWAVPLYDATAIAVGILMLTGVVLWRKTDVR